MAHARGVPLSSFDGTLASSAPASRRAVLPRRAEVIHNPIRGLLFATLLAAPFWIMIYWLLR